jgi:hypothetical protein
LLGLGVFIGTGPAPGAELSRFMVLNFLFISMGLFFFLALPILKPSQNIGIIMVMAIALRFAFWSQPMSDDVYRYVWEGQMLVQGENPWLKAPADPSLDVYSTPLRQKINHPELTAIYSPGVVALFALVVRLSEHPLVMKVLAVLFDLGTLVLILYLLALRQKVLKWSLLYALNPLVLISFAGQAHLDSIMIFMMMAAFIAYEKKWFRSMFAFIALGFQVKYTALLIIPALIKKSNIKHLWVFAVLAALPFIPFLIHDIGAPFRTFVHFGTAMAHNGPIHGILRSITTSIPLATFLCGLLFMVFAYFSFRAHRFYPELMILSFLQLFFILSPTVHLWYITWAIPFAVFYPTWSLFILSWSFLFAFSADQSFINHGVWRQPLIYSLMIWTPYLALLIAEKLWTVRRRYFKPQALKDLSCSVVIPTLNAGDYLSLCLQNLNQLSPAPYEIIISDGGSKDSTLNIAREYGLKIVEGPPGRGSQILRGIQSAKGEITLILHADTHLEKSVLARVQKVMLDPKVAGGAVGQHFKQSSFLLALIEMLNDLRGGLTGIYFGDQVQFFRTRAALSLNWMPDWPLMEDVESSLRMTVMGQSVFLWGGATVANYKWDAGFGRRILLVLKLLFKYFTKKLKGSADMNDLYLSYYKQAKGNSK